jgi:hypothetical protein
VRKQEPDFIGNKLNRIFVIHAPVNPFLIVDVFEQMQNRSLYVRRRADVSNATGIAAAKLLIRNMKHKRMTWPQLFVLENQVLRDRPIPIAG